VVEEVVVHMVKTLPQAVEVQEEVVLVAVLMVMDLLEL
jgi:hypothetical protein